MAWADLTSTVPYTPPHDPPPFPRLCSAVRGALADLAHPEDASAGYRCDDVVSRLVADYARAFLYFLVIPVKDSIRPAALVHCYADEAAVWVELERRVQQLLRAMDGIDTSDAQPQQLQIALNQQRPLWERIDAAAQLLSSQHAEQQAEGNTALDLRLPFIRTCVWGEAILTDAAHRLDRAAFPLYLLGNRHSLDQVIRVNCADDLRHWLLKARRWDRLHREKVRNSAATAELVREEDERLKADDDVEAHTMLLLRHMLRLHQHDPTTRIAVAVHHARRLDLSEDERQQEKEVVRKRVANARAVEEESRVMRDLQGRLTAQLHRPLEELTPIDPSAPMLDAAEHPSASRLLPLLQELWEWTRSKGLDSAVPFSELSCQQQRLWRWLTRIITCIHTWRSQALDAHQRPPRDGRGQKEVPGEHWQALLDAIELLTRVQDVRGSGR